MKYPKGVPMHGKSAAHEFSKRPVMTGCPTMDAAIHHSPNKDMAARMVFYCDTDGNRSAYNGYDGYNGYTPE